MRYLPEARRGDRRQSPDAGGRRRAAKCRRSGRRNVPTERGDPVTDSMPSRGKPERYLALLAAAVCSLISIRVFRLVGSMQPVWPFPALYLVEVTSLTWVGAWVLIRERPGSAAVVCAVAGVLTGFSILGAWTIGFFYVPVVLLLGIAGGWATWRRRSPLPVGLASFAVGFAGEVVLMLAILQMLPSLTTFWVVHAAA